MASQRNNSSKLALRQHAALALAYTLMIGAMVGVFMLIRAYGERITTAAVPVVRNGHPEANAGTVGHVLLALLIIAWYFGLISPHGLQPAPGSLR